MTPNQQRQALDLLSSIKHNNSATLEALKELAPLDLETTSGLFLAIKPFVSRVNDAWDELTTALANDNSEREPERNE